MSGMREKEIKGNKGGREMSKKRDRKRGIGIEEGERK